MHMYVSIKQDKAGKQNKTVGETLVLIILT